MINSSCFHINNKENIFNNEIRKEPFLESNGMNINLVIYVRNYTINNESIT